MPRWEFTADYFQGCSCDYGCPCEFEAPPTLGFCEGVDAWRITKGHFDNVSLDGLALGFSARWPKAIHLGNGTACIFVDERATEEQRNALLQIASGAAGGMPFEILITTLTTVMDPQFVGFKFNLAGKNSSVMVGKDISLALSPIKNPVTGQDEGVRVEHDTGFIFKGADCVNTLQCDSKVKGLEFSWPQKAGFVTTVNYHN